MLRKNVSSQFVYIAGVNATTGAALTGATISGRRCLDGTFAAIGATITEDTGLGFYKVALTQADTNGNDVAYFFTATNMVPICLTVVMTAADPTDTVRLGLTALPNVASGSAGAIITSGTGSAQLSVSSGLVTLAGVTHTGAVIPTVTTLTNLPAITANWLTAAGTAADFGSEIATAIWTDTTAGDFTVAASIGKSVMNGVALGTGLTINGYTGNTVQTGDSFARIGVAGAGLTNIDLPNQTMDIVGNITGNLSGSVGSVTGAVGSVTGAVGSVTGAVGSVTGNVGGNVVGSVASVTAVVSADITKIGSDTTALTAFKQAVLGNVVGTVGAASTTTSIVTSSLTPAAAVIDQFKGRIVIFDKDTATANLRGQGTDITASTALGVLTVTALTTAPASSDTFTIT